MGFEWRAGSKQANKLTSFERSTGNTMASTASNQMVLHDYGSTHRTSLRVPREQASWKLPVACRSVLVALVVGCAAASESLASEPDRSGERAREVMASIPPEGLIAAWLGASAVIFALYSYEKTRAPQRSRLALHDAPGRQPGRDAAVARRLILLRGATSQGPDRSAAEPGVGREPSKAASVPDRPASGQAGKRPSGPTPVPEAKSPVGESLGVGVTQSDVEASPVVDAGVTGTGAGGGHESPAAAPQGPSAPAAPPEAAPASAVASADPSECVQRCVTLRAEGRFADAARLARDGLAGGGAPGPLLVELSRAEFARGHLGAAIEIARDAHFAGRSRESVEHLIRLLTETRRFTRADGPALRRAASRHPRQPLLLHAAGVFEALYGEPAAAEKWLRAALPLAPDEASRRAVSDELSRVQEATARSAS
jgi:hypothetical protein